MKKLSSIVASLIFLLTTSCDSGPPPKFTGTAENGDLELTVEGTGSAPYTTGNITVKGKDENGNSVTVFEGTLSYNPNHPTSGTLKDSSGAVVGTITKTGPTTFTFSLTNQNYQNVLPDSTTAEMEEET